MGTVVRQAAVTATGILEVLALKSLEAVYQGMVGMVLALGPDAYTGEEFRNWHKPCVKDWVLFRPNSGVRFNDKDVPLRFVFDDCVLAPLQNPACITR